MQCFLGILRYQIAFRVSKPVALKDVDIGVIVHNDLVDREFLLDQNRRGHQAHVVVGVRDHILDQLLAEGLALAELEGVGIKRTQKLLKLVLRNCVAVLVIQLVEEQKNSWSPSSLMLSNSLFSECHLYGLNYLVRRAFPFSTS